ncbi:hypothetical protein HMPREF9374_3481 [Desmospora sp. 8437]|nr:hypothetical protein HMPREF9374_3481 [Desmospora sp. 8437]
MSGVPFQKIVPSFLPFHNPRLEGCHFWHPFFDMVEFGLKRLNFIRIMVVEDVLFF